MLLPKMNFNEEFVQLIKEVREHRQQMGRCPSSASDVNIPLLLLQIVKSRVYEADYEDITGYFQKTKIEYNEAIKAIQKVVEASVF